MSSQAGEGYVEGRVSQSQTIQELRRSFSLHVRRPVILAIVIGGALLQFGVEMWLGRRSPTPADLAGMFAAPPIDSFTWAPSALGLMALMILLMIRLMVICAFIFLVLDLRPAGDRILKTGGAYLASVLSFGLLSAGLAWLGPLAGRWIVGFLGSGAEDPYFAGPRLALGLVFFFAFVPLLVLVTVIISPFIAKAAAGQSLKPRLGHGSVWLLAASSAVLYLATAVNGQGGTDFSSGSFATAFLVLGLQSVIFGAIVHTTAGSAVLRTLSGQVRRTREPPAI